MEGGGEKNLQDMSERQSGKKEKREKSSVTVWSVSYRDVRKEKSWASGNIQLLVEYGEEKNWYMKWKAS